MKCIWYYNVYILTAQLNNLSLLKYKWLIISKRWVCLQHKIHIHDWVFFEYKVRNNMEICDLNS